MADLAKMVLKLEAQTAQYQRELEKAQRTNRKFAKQTKGSLASVKTAYVALAAGVVGAFASMRNGIERQADLFDLTQRLGATSEGLSRLQYAAEQSGVSVRTLNMGLQRMVRRVAEAANGTGEARGALEELNISASELNKLKPEKQFQVLSDAIMEVESPADRVRLAMKLFDSEGVSLIQTMQGGSEALRAYGAEADKLGLTVGTNAAAASKRASDAFTRLSGVFTGASNALAAQFAPEIELAASFLTEALPKAIGFTRAAFMRLQQGAIAVTTRFVELRARWNELMGDTEQAAELYESVRILRQMNADLGTQIDNLKNGTGATVEYGEATERATHALQDFSIASDQAAAASAKKAEADRKALEGVIRSLETEEEALQRSYDERRKIILESTELTEQQRQELMSRLIDDTLSEVEVKTKRVQDNIKTNAEKNLNPFDRVFGENALEGLFSDLNNIEERFKQMLLNLAAQALASGLSNLFGGGGGVTGFFGGLFGGARANGGPVTAGRLYQVNERGPEFFMPHTNGTIVPAHQSEAAANGPMNVIAALGDDQIQSMLGGKLGEQVVVAHLRRNRSTIQALAR